MLWLCGIVSLPCFVAAWFTRDIQTLSNVLAAVGAMPVVTTCLGFVYFAIFRPEKLQSEDYQVRHEALEIIRQKGGLLQIAPSSIEAIANPHLPPIQEIGR